MAVDFTSFNAALKVHYGPQRMKEISFKRRPLLAMLPKYTKFGGRNMPLPLKYAASQNRASTFGTAQRSSGAGSFGTSQQQLVEFLLTTKLNYGLGFLDGRTIKASEGDKNAFVRAVKSEMDSVLEGLLDDIHQDLYTDDTGARFQHLGLDSGSTYNAAAADLVKLEVGMIVSFTSGTTKTAALRDSGTPREVTAVDRSGGTFTLSSAISGATSGDWVVVAGDRVTGVISGDGLKMSGLDAWIPADVASLSGTFKNVDRTVDTTKLGGVRVDGSSLTISEALIEGVIETNRYGGMIDHYFMNHTDVKNLINELGSKVEYDVVKDPEGIVGFRALKIYTPMGTVDVIGDHQCPVGTAWGLDMDTWLLASTGPVPHLLSLDGNRMLREASSDSYEFRFGAYSELGCSAPGRNARVTLPTAA